MALLTNLLNIPIYLVVIIHIYIVFLEMYLWDTSYGRKAFNLTAQLSADTRVLAANQGLYNGFLAAGLIWGLYEGGVMGTKIELFFLSCVLVAGVFGACTSTIKTLYIQTAPAVVAMGVLLVWG
ncbi:hypothetical protein G7Y89_g10466 [Cudoniella acicularis]|uniref:DUF1304 domain-containing protein n=1 Tax=Cudoniella acicularis TaxID=354080 RepID=A0A8H4VYQ8_9HELO|nr:hypothetical protein G7Y89_g10466 [Cudoniella acicularis]